MIIRSRRRGAPRFDFDSKTGELIVGDNALASTFSGEFPYVIYHDKVLSQGMMYKDESGIHERNLLRGASTIAAGGRLLCFRIGEKRPTHSPTSNNGYSWVSIGGHPRYGREIKPLDHLIVRPWNNRKPIAKPIVVPAATDLPHRIPGVGNVAEHEVLGIVAICKLTRSCNLILWNTSSDITTRTERAVDFATACSLREKTKEEYKILATRLGSTVLPPIPKKDAIAEAYLTFFNKTYGTTVAQEDFKK